MDGQLVAVVVHVYILGELAGGFGRRHIMFLSNFIFISLYSIAHGNGQ